MSIENFYPFQFPRSERTVQEIRIEINNAAVNLNKSACNIVTASRGTRKMFAKSFGEYSSSFTELRESVWELAGTCCGATIVSGLGVDVMFDASMLFSSPDMKAQVSYSDRLLSV
jgi:hypothetical protein